jgi:hypothetical protein
VLQQPRGHGKPCSGTLKRTKSCNMDFCEGMEPVDCVLGEWSDWSSCTASCGGGEHQRHRAVMSEPRHGGLPCDTDTLVEAEACNSKPCDTGPACVWSDWSPWKPCSRECGGGQRTRSRELNSVSAKALKPQGLVAVVGQHVWRSVTTPAVACLAAGLLAASGLVRRRRPREPGFLFVGDQLPAEPELEGAAD